MFYPIIYQRIRIIIFIILIIFLITIGLNSEKNINQTVSASRGQNTPPIIQNVSIEPPNPYTNDDLQATFVILDMDNDEIESQYINWYKNGLEQPQFYNYDKIPSDSTKKGQLWQFAIRVFDGENFSNTSYSQLITINNTPPEIIYYPSNEKLIINETESLVFLIDVNDIDGDLINIQWFNNEEIVGDENSYDLRSDYDWAGNYKIKVIVQDFGYGSVNNTNEWNVTVYNTNREPILNIIEPLDPNSIIKVGESLPFEVLFYDMDIEDIVYIKWYIDNNQIMINASSIIYHPLESDIGKHKMDVIIDDGEIIKSYSWNITVRSLDNDDSDGDGVKNDIDPFPDSNKDSDNDSLPDDYETEILSTNPSNNDTDGDGFNDDEEINAGSDPNDAESTPIDLDGDGVPNKEDEYPRDPNKWEKEKPSYLLIFISLLIIIILFSFGFQMYSRINRKNVLNNEIRMNVFNYINENPGEHFGGISKNLNLNESTLRHHLKSLKQTDKIRIESDRKFKYYYPILHNHLITLTPIQKEIMKIVKQQNGISTNQLAKKMNKERQTITYHLNNLNEKNLLNSEKKGKIIYWSLKEEQVS